MDRPGREILGNPKAGDALIYSRPLTPANGPANISLNFLHPDLQPKRYPWLTPLLSSGLAGYSSFYLFQVVYFNVYNFYYLYT